MLGRGVKAVENREMPGGLLYLLSIHPLKEPLTLVPLLPIPVPRSAGSGIMVEKYPETPGKLSTLSTMLYKQIVDNLLSLGKREADKP